MQAFQSSVFFQLWMEIDCFIFIYSMMQADRNSICGDVVLDSFDMAYMKTTL